MLSILKKVKAVVFSAPAFAFIALLSGITMAMGGTPGIVVGICVILAYVFSIFLMELRNKKSS